jgi:3-oxoacyl-[acyl-carrier-protein] synthase-3
MATNSGTHARITGVGAEIPADVITTAEVEERARLHDRFRLPRGWLERVTGVRERRWAGPEVQPSELAVAAARKALADAGVRPLEVDTVVFAGITRDCLEPATANLVAEGVGATNARVFDLSNACNGLIDAVDVADSLIGSGKAERVLVATGERATLAIEWQPRTFEDLLASVASLVVGDGGGAVLLEPSDDPRRGLRAREFRSAASEWRHATGGRFRPATEACEACGGILDRAFRCDGRSLFAAAFGLLLPTMEAVMRRTGWSYDDLDVVFCHQPTRRFVENAASQLGGDVAAAARRLWTTAERFGNTSTFSLPLAMAEAAAAGTLVPGTRVLVLAPSSGVSAAAVTMVW